MISTEPESNKKKLFYYKISRNFATISGIFAVVIAILILANFYQIKSIDPLNSTVLQNLIREYKDNPEKQNLQNEIRSLHLLSRKSYFSNIWLIRIGGVLVIFAVGLMILSLKIKNRMLQKIPDPRQFPDLVPSDKERRLRQLLISVTGVGLVIISGIFSFLSQSHLSENIIDQPVDQYPSREEFQNNWTNFRGYGSNGHAYHTNIPLNWDGNNDEGILWKTEVSRQGYSSPIVWKDRIFITGGDKEIREVYCYNLKSGALLWQRQVFSPTPIADKLSKLRVDPSTGYAAPTMTTDGKYVFAIFATGDLVTFDFFGNHIWGKNLGIPDNHYAHSSSLICYENLLYVQYDHWETPQLFAFDVLTGNIIWRVDRTTISWASPILVDTGIRKELIFADSKFVKSYDPKTGELLWSEKCLSGEVGPSPAYADGMVFVANEYSIAAGIQIITDSDSTSKILWQYKDKLPNTASPAATSKFVFLATSGGTISCLDAKKGDLIWEHDFRNGFYSSPIIVGDRVYALDLKGIMHIFKLADHFEIINEPKLYEPSSCTPAYIDGLIILRGDDHLFCIGNPGN